MNFKQAIGLSFLSIGVVFMIFALNAAGYFPDHKAVPPQVTSSPLSPSEHLPVGNTAAKEECDPKAFYILLGGVLMVGSGCWIAIRYKN